jgi:two-component system, LytTR family, response regulator
VTTGKKLSCIHIFKQLEETTLERNICWMNVIKIVLVDDNEDSLEIMEHFIEDLPTFEVIGTCRDGEELIEQVMKKKPDLALVDINMPKKNGVQAIKECLTFKPDLKFIFITGYDEYAIEAFKISAIDYVVKPIERSRLYMALEKAKSIILYEKAERLYTKKLPLRSNTCTYYIPLNQILFIEKSGKKCLVHAREGMYETYDTIRKITERLDETFFPTHRSYVVNVKEIAYIVPQNETYLAYFRDYDKHASVSKLKINELRDKIAALLDE